MNQSILAHLPGPMGIRVNAVLPGSTNMGLKDDFTMMAGIKPVGTPIDLSAILTQIQQMSQQ